MQPAIIPAFVLLLWATHLPGQEVLPTGWSDDSLPAGVIARLGVPRHSGADETPALAFSPDGKLLASAGMRLERPGEEDPLFPIQILDGQTARRIRTLAGSTAPVESLQFSPSGELLLSVGGGEMVSAWSVDDGQCRWTCSLFHAVAACFSHDAKHVFVTDASDRVWVLEAASGKTIRQMNSQGHSKPAEDPWLSIGNGKQHPGKAGPWKTVEVIRSPNVTRIRQRNGKGRQRTVNYFHDRSGGRAGAKMRFLPDGKTMVSVSAAGKIRYRDVLTGKAKPDRAAEAPIVLLRRKPRSSAPLVAGYLWPSVGHQSVILSAGDTVTLLDAGSPKGATNAPSRPPPSPSTAGHPGPPGHGRPAKRSDPMAAAPGRTVWAAGSVACSPDGRLAALMDKRALNESAIRVVDLRKNQTVSEFVLRSLVIEPEVSSNGYLEPRMRRKLKPVHAAFSPSGKRLAVEVQGQIRICDVETGKEIPRQGAEGKPPQTRAEEHQVRVDAIAFSPDGTLLATAGRDYTTRLWSAGTGRQLHQWTHCWRFGYECSVAFSPDSRLLAIDVGGAVNLVKCSDGKRLRRLVEPPPPGKKLFRAWPTAIAFTPDGRRLALSRFNERTLKWWDVESGKLSEQTELEVTKQNKPLYSRTYLTKEHAKALAFSPSLRWLGTTDFNGMVYFHWDTHTGRPAFNTASQVGFTSARLSPDENLLALGVPNEPIRIIDARKGVVVRELKVPRGFAYPRAFLDEGRILVADHDDGNTRFWNLNSGEEVYRLRGFRVQTCSDNGRYAASVSEKTVPYLDGRHAAAVWRYAVQDSSDEPVVLSSTILIWDLRLLKEAGGGPDRRSDSAEKTATDVRPSN